jgi:hypothetical protein
MKRIKQIAVATAAAATLGTGLAVVSAPAANAAGNPPCATRAEFRKIHVGQSVARTQHIIGSKGRVTMAGSWLSQRQWHVCGSSFGWVTLTYTSGRLDNKIML